MGGDREKPQPSDKQHQEQDLAPAPAPALAPALALAPYVGSVACIAITSTAAQVRDTIYEACR